MARCLICDWSEVGSLSSPTEGHRKLVFSESDNGFLCDQCFDEDQEPDQEDLDDPYLLDEGFDD